MSRPQPSRGTSRASMPKRRIVELRERGLSPAPVAAGDAADDAGNISGVGRNAVAVRRFARSSIVLRWAVKRRVEFTSSALRTLASIGKVHRRLVLDGIRVHLIDNDPLEITQNRFPLKRPSAYAERELRLDNWRVFYTVVDDGVLAFVNLMGERRGNKLFLEGEEFGL